MQEERESNITIRISTVPLKVEAQEALSHIINNKFLRMACERYVSNLTDVEIFFSQGNCIVTNKGYHYATVLKK